jgi:AAA domain
LIIIDEAGMADTLSLDTAVKFAVDRGASVRLIGDDQQLAAIGAGGVLRDIKNVHGTLHLTELHRFTNPAEAQASPTCGTAIPAHSASISIMAAFMRQCTSSASCGQRPWLSHRSWPGARHAAVISAP